jgi:hypothetical protein
MAGTATGLAWAVGALVAVALVYRAAGGRRLPALVPVLLGYLAGEGGLDWLAGERAGRAAGLALMLGAGWCALAAASAGASTFRRAATRSGIVWAAGIAVVGPSCLAGALAPVVVSVAGPAGLSIPALALLVAAAILADPSPFRSKTAAAGVPSHRLREAVRTSEAFHACALLAWPAYWAVARSLSLGEGLRADALVASFALSFGMGIGLGIAGMMALRFLSAGLAVAALALAVVAAAALVASQLAVSCVGSCFIAGLFMGQEEASRKVVFNVAHNLEGPFRILFLLAAGAAAPRWTGAAAPLLVVVVVLAGRPILGFLADALAGAAAGAGAGRRFGWILVPPSVLAAAMVVEAHLLLSEKSAAAGEAAVPLDPGAFVLNWEAGSLSPVAPFLLATAAGSLAGRWALKRRMRVAGGSW